MMFDVGEMQSKCRIVDSKDITCQNIEQIVSVGAEKLR